MKRLFTLLTIALMSVAVNAQELPDVEVQNLQGQKIKASTLTHDGPMVISFWATWCKPCINELNAMAEYYEELHEDHNLRMIIISIDDPRTMRKVAPFVASQGWEYEVLCDPNSALRRAMGVNNVPHTFLLDADGNIVWQANKYVPGEEEELVERIERVAAGEDLEE